MKLHVDYVNNNNLAISKVFSRLCKYKPSAMDFYECSLFENETLSYWQCPYAVFILNIMRKMIGVPYLLFILTNKVYGRDTLIVNSKWPKYLQEMRNCITFYYSF